MATENKNLSAYDKATIPNANGLRFGIVVSEWNSEITEGLYNGAIDALLDCGAQRSDVIRWDVPGSFELTFGSKKMIQSIAFPMFTHYSSPQVSIFVLLHKIEIS